MSTCPRCGADFTCGMADQSATQPCWCTGLPALDLAASAPTDGASDACCYCPACLRELIAELIERRHLL